MTLAIMQPYIFPYIGYFQLIEVADKFVVYDDVTFIKQGWINRNYLLLNGKKFLFTVPLKDISSNKLIKDTQIDDLKYPSWARKFLLTIEQAYKKAPFFSIVYDLLEATFKRDHNSISSLAAQSLINTSDYLGLKTAFINSSAIYRNEHLKGQERVLDICKAEGVDRYINVPGGQNLYSKEEFERNKMKLEFISSKEITYPQFNNSFIPWLSIIDVMMFNDVNKIHEFTKNYDLI